MVVQHNDACLRNLKVSWARMSGGGTTAGTPRHRLRERILYAGLGSGVALLLIIAANPRLIVFIEGLGKSGWMWFWIVLVSAIWLSLVLLAVSRDQIGLDGYFTSGFAGPGLPYMALDAAVKWVS